MLFIALFICTMLTIHLQNDTASNTCYVFPVPQPEGLSLAAAVFAPLPFGSLVNYGSDRDPGFLLVSSTGQVRFWEGINMALSGADKFHSIAIYLSAGELVKSMVSLQVRLFILFQGFTLKNKPSARPLHPGHLAK
jgi:nuclear pore complex protein Nup133